ncbi:MerR family transcriptional regulator [Metabacillus sp. HB246100]|uniref:MerR family transcriptional regulator n=1 Tax=Bacillus weihaiensis TaxID=1547283 RepID=UPI002355920B|nr:MerR family transcriptional regulator [Bacillus weihaiensis]
MSTAAVAKLLGVSRRTLMRWVNQQDLQLEKNEQGHYQFTQEDIEQLKQIQQKTEPIQSTSTRKGSVQRMPAIDVHTLNTIEGKLEELDRKVRNKADDVVSYQLLLHRREMDELVSTIQKLENRITELETNQKRDVKKDPRLVYDQNQAPKNRRKSFISSLFGV